jgi:hypothetical protein
MLSQTGNGFWLTFYHFGQNAVTLSPFNLFPNYPNFLF